MGYLGYELSLLPSPPWFNAFKFFRNSPNIYTNWLLTIEGPPKFYPFCCIARGKWIFSETYFSTGISSDKDKGVHWNLNAFYPAVLLKSLGQYLLPNYSKMKIQMLIISRTCLLGLHCCYAIKSCYKEIRPNKHCFTWPNANFSTYSPPFPVEIGTKLYLREIDEIDEDKNSVSIDLAFATFWFDPKLDLSNGTTT